MLVQIIFILMSLDKQDLEIIERLIFKNADDIAVSIARSFERLEERIDAAESRIYGRFADMEDKIEACRQESNDNLSEVRDEMREISRIREL